MKRSPLLRKTPLRQRGKKPRLRAGRIPPNPAYLAWVRKQPCVGLEDWPSNSHGDHGVQGHYCFGPIDPSHERNRVDESGRWLLTGAGMKEPDESCIPMCRALHNQWETRCGRYDGWSTEKRSQYMRERQIQFQARYQAETGIALLPAARAA